jgi:AraC family transcriptional regulator
MDSLADLNRHSQAMIDYRQPAAADSLLPQPARLSSAGWNEIHLAIFQEPAFEIAEHQHTLHVVACGLPAAPGRSQQPAAGDRWLAGQRQTERRLPGDIAVIPAGIAHRCSWHDATQFMVLALEPGLLRRLGQDWVDPDSIELVPCFMSQPDELLQHSLLRLKAELETGGIASPLLVDSLKISLAVHLLRHYCATQPRWPASGGGLSSRQLAGVEDYIAAHLDQDLKLAELAAIAQLSPYHFLRLFKQSLGLTPHQYILQRRVAAAQQLLHGACSIAEVALRTGFCDQSHLTRCFKQALGVTPKQYLQRRT